jgi:hypothetical protein
VRDGIRRRHLSCRHSYMANGYVCRDRHDGYLKYQANQNLRTHQHVPGVTFHHQTERLIVAGVQHRTVLEHVIRNG